MKSLVTAKGERVLPDGSGTDGGGNENLFTKKEQKNISSIYYLLNDKLVKLSDNILAYEPEPFSMKVANISKDGSSFKLDVNVKYKIDPVPFDTYVSFIYLSKYKNLFFDAMFLYYDAHPELGVSKQDIKELESAPLSRLRKAISPDQREQVAESVKQLRRKARALVRADVFSVFMHFFVFSVLLDSGDGFVSGELKPTVSTKHAYSEFVLTISDELKVNVQCVSKLNGKYYINSSDISYFFEGNSKIKRSESFKQNTNTDTDVEDTEDVSEKEEPKDYGKLPKIQMSGKQLKEMFREIYSIFGEEFFNKVKDTFPEHFKIAKETED